MPTIYTAITIVAQPNQYDTIIAYLADAGAEAFEERASDLIAYVDRQQEVFVLQRIEQLQQHMSLTYSKSAVENKNWNEEWEKQFEPVAIDDRLYIHASFHRVPAAYDLQLLIDPKMAFGTGHHATTYLMCECTLDYFDGRDASVPTGVLDYGCGTGVLAILASRLGATTVDAVDIEVAAYENTLENAERNGVDLHRVVHGTLDDLPGGQPYDLILANINRNVLLASAQTLYDRLQTGGHLYLSGILTTDQDVVLKRMNSVGLRTLSTYTRDQWSAIALTRDRS